MKYFIPNLAKGLVDDVSRVTEGYKQKALELENFYIKDNNNIVKRPPLERIEELETEGYKSIKQHKDSIIAHRFLP